MKPRTKLQQKVYSLSKNLLSLTKDQENWIYDNCLDHIAYRTKKDVSCLDCGCVWEGPKTSKFCICPLCDTKLQIKDTRKKLLDQGKTTIAFMQVIEGFQVIRFFEVSSYHKSGTEKKQWYHEIIQQWFKPDEKLTIIAKTVSYCNTGWGGELEIRTTYSNYWYANKYDVYAYRFLPDSEMLAIFQRNGFNLKLSSIRPFSFLKNLLTSTITETLLKSGQLNLAAHNSNDKVNRYWSSLKICIRNKYIVKDAGIYLDYLDLLSYFNNDLRNAKFLCPKNLKYEHDRLVKKKTAILKRQAKERVIARAKANAEKIIADEKAYQQAKAAFIGLIFTDGELTVKVLENIKEFIKEADAHGHCVFTNEYYNKPDSLILSASLGDKPLETIELSLSKMKVMQARGKGNQATEFNKQIIDLVNKNIPVIKQKFKQLKTAAA